MENLTMPDQLKTPSFVAKGRQADLEVMDKQMRDKREEMQNSKRNTRKKNASRAEAPKSGKNQCNNEMLNEKKDNEVAQSEVLKHEYEGNSTKSIPILTVSASPAADNSNAEAAVEVSNKKKSGVKF